MLKPILDEYRDSYEFEVKDSETGEIIDFNKICF